MRYTAFALAALLLILLSTAPLFSQASSPGQYRVESGDTLYSIARSFGVSEEAVRRANEIEDPRSLAVGEELTIPNTYSAASGDTYWSIAQRHGMTVDELLALNDRSPDSVLHAGDLLLVADDDVRVADGPADAGEFSLNQDRIDRKQAESVDKAEVQERSVNEEDDETGVPAEGSDSVDRDDTAANDAGGSSGPSVGKRPEVAATEPVGRRTVLWPHPGERSSVGGKFPGIAISARAGDAVYSVSTGRVIYAGPHTAFGRVVFVRTDDGYLYVYAGNSELNVRVGDRVQVGTRIGSAGTGGNGGDSAAGTAVQSGELYFSVWKNDEYVDPAEAPRG